MSLDRIDKILSHEGFGTRKDVRRILRASAVLINGNVVTDPGYHCDIDNDEISVDGQIISVQKNIYLMMNKPQNVVCANKDGLHDTVFSLLAEQYRTGFALENLHLILLTICIFDLKRVKILKDRYFTLMILYVQLKEKLGMYQFFLRV